MRSVLLLLFFFWQTDYQEEGLKALEAKQYPAAIAAFEKAVAADAKDYGAHFHLGLAHSMAGNAGAAILLPQDQLTPQHLAELRNLSRQQLAQMAEKARELARPEATAEVARICREVAK